MKPFIPVGIALLAVLLLVGCPDEVELYDHDHDGVIDEEDCEPEDASVYPGAEEVCDGKDNDCDGMVDEGQDTDGDGFKTCEGDCDDSNADTYPGAEELCDREDNDCDGVVPEDEQDHDGDGWTACEGDCSDADVDLTPDDLDDDGFSTCDEDCDDDDPAVFPTADEGCDGIDTDCDGELGGDEVDDDGDAFTECEGDCDDGDPVVHPGAADICDDVLDNDCDAVTDPLEADADLDGYTGCDGDCDDADASANLDDADGDGVDTCSGDCDDEDETSYPGADETCDGIDHDCSGTADDDPTCAPSITGLDGDGSDDAVNDVDGETDGIANTAPVQHRFQQSWLVSGTHLDIVTDTELAADGWPGPTYTDADGLTFDLGVTEMQRTLLLPSTLLTGAFLLTLTTGGGSAQAQVYVLQGEAGISCWDANGDGVDDPGEDVNGDGIWDAADCEGPQGQQGDTLLNCSGDDCTLTGYSNLFVSGDVGAGGGVSGTTATFSDLGSFAYLEAGELTVIDTYELPGCPQGYMVMGYSAAGGALCEDPITGDEMVQVGDFWIDRYEMSIWDSQDCGISGTQYGEGVDDYDSAIFYDNGNWDDPLYACSVEGVLPSQYTTWFQAQQACELSGKSLCTNEQWQAAAAGTAESSCNTAAVCNGPNPWPTGDTMCGGCESVWGAVDMVGNLMEWTALWEGHPGWNGSENLMSSEYGDDGYWAGGPPYSSMPDYGVSGSWRPASPGIDANGDEEGEYFGPAAAIRGGYYAAGAGAGVHSLYLSFGPSQSLDTVGARCCTQR